MLCERIYYTVDLHGQLTRVLHGKLSHRGCLKVLIYLVFLIL